MDLDAEFDSYLLNLRRQDVERLTAAGVKPTDILVHQMVGAASVQIDRDGLWRPDEDGARMYITPARVHSANQLHDIESPNPWDTARYIGETVDLVAWHPDRTEQWALRTGSAMTLGGMQYRLADELTPLLLHRDPLAWLRAGEGLVLLTRDREEQRMLLLGVERIIPADALHAEELRRVLAQRSGPEIVEREDVPQQRVTEALRARDEVLREEQPRRRLAMRL